MENGRRFQEALQDIAESVPTRAGIDVDYVEAAAAVGGGGVGDGGDGRGSDGDAYPRNEAACSETSSTPNSSATSVPPSADKIELIEMGTPYRKALESISMGASAAESREAGEQRVALPGRVSFTVLVLLGNRAVTFSPMMNNHTTTTPPPSAAHSVERGQSNASV